MEQLHLTKFLTVSGKGAGFYNLAEEQGMAGGGGGAEGLKCIVGSRSGTGREDWSMWLD